MKYKTIYTNKTSKEDTRTIMLTADNIRQARETANNADNLQPGEYCKVYCVLDTPEAITEAATEIVKRTTANMISREGGEIQYRLYNAIRTPHPTDPDIMDCLGVVNLALWENKDEETETAYKIAYKALNAHLYNSRQIRLSVTAMRTIYIEDIDGDIINVDDNINCILAPHEKYIPNNHNVVTRPEKRLLQNIIPLLTPMQLTVLKYLACGYSQRQTAKKLGRNYTTINEHVKLIREKCANALVRLSIKP